MHSELSEIKDQIYAALTTQEEQLAAPLRQADAQRANVALAPQQGPAATDQQQPSPSAQGLQGE